MNRDALTGKMRAEPAGPLLIRWSLGAMLAAAGAMKAAHPAELFSALLGYQLPLPDTALRFAAVTLPWLELLCGAALVCNFWRETVRPMVATLCLVFVGTLAQALARGLDFDCGCFGPATLGWLERPATALIRAALLLAASLYLLPFRGSEGNAASPCRSAASRFRPP